MPDDLAKLAVAKQAVGAQAGHVGAIKAGLAVFWSQPNTESIYEEISRRAAANPAAWSGSLDVNDRLWLVDKVATMAIYGERLVILDQQGSWLKVAAIAQPFKLNEPGYPGWILVDQVCSNSAYLTTPPGSPEAVVSVPETALCSNSALSKELGRLSYQTRLPILTESENFLKVRLPDGDLGYLSRREAKKTTELFFSHQNIVQEARRFLDLRYLWGGASSWGFDCSGFTFRLYQSQGITIPRDASEQAQAGIPVAEADLQPGDLLFFAAREHAKNHCQAAIHHVGMYIGQSLMCHSPNSQSAIRIEPFDAGVYGSEFWGARRYQSPLINAKT